MLQYLSTIQSLRTLWKFYGEWGINVRDVLPTSSPLICPPPLIFLMTVYTIVTDHSKDFDTGASATCSRVTLGELVGELEPVTNWLVLGLHLGVPLEELCRIEGEHIDSECSRVMMLGVFMERCDVDKQNWSTIVSALTEMGELQLAKSIATKKDCKCSS